MKTLFLDMDGVIANLPDGQSQCWNMPEFWATLPKYDHSDELVDYVCSRFDVHILSSNGGGPASTWGKMQWLGMYYPWLVEGAIFTKCKYLLVGPNRILIDDDPENVRPWQRSRLAGCHGILFPNPDHPDQSTELPISYEEILRWLEKLSL